MKEAPTILLLAFLLGVVIWIIAFLALPDPPREQIGEKPTSVQPLEHGAIANSEQLQLVLRGEIDAARVVIYVFTYQNHGYLIAKTYAGGITMIHEQSCVERDSKRSPLIF